MMTTIKRRIDCPKCNAYVRLRADGKISKHNFYTPFRNPMPVPCPYSGRLFAEVDPRR